MSARPIGVLDSESDPFSIGREPKPFIFGVYLGNEGGYHEFRKPDQVANFLHDKRFVVYAHNGGKFDYMTRTDDGDSMLNYLSAYDEVLVINGRLARFKIGQCEFRDSWNILPVPLDAYKKQKIDYAIMERSERHKKKNWRLIRDYLRSDCFNLYELVNEYIGRFGVNLTQASGAMKFWMKMGGQEPPRSDADYFDQFKDYYYGGRVECFERGIVDVPFKVVDIKSAYPRAMLDYHPFGTLPNQIEELTGTALRGAALQPQGFYSVECVSNGAFPFRDDDEEKLLYPVDNVRRLYHITGWELQAALDLKLLREVRIVKAYKFLDLQSFRGFIQHCYDERMKAAANGDEAGKLLWKLLMNSLYGKFAANPRNYGQFTLYEAKYADAIEAFPADEYGRKESYAGMMGPWALAEKELAPDRMNFYNVCTSASITGFVRAYLLRAMKKCSRVLYCDTDSIAAARVDGLPFGKALGEWELEGEFNRAAIAGRKLYAFRYAKPKVDDDGKRITWKVRSKGVRLDWREIVKVARGGEVEFDPEVPTFSVYHEPRFIKRTVRMT